MSKDSADKPDEYESIFDETNVEKMNSEAKIIDVVEDVATDKDSEYQTIENDLDGNSAYKQGNIDSIDAEDIEDGIFAPERKTIKSSKKSSSLMWSVSVLAIIGVAGFVYFSSPDILSKVSDNIAGNNEVILPQELPVENVDVGALNPPPVAEVKQDIKENINQPEFAPPQVDNEIVLPADAQSEQDIVIPESTTSQEVPASLNEPPKEVIAQIASDIVPPPSNNMTETDNQIKVIDALAPSEESAEQVTTLPTETSTPATDIEPVSTVPPPVTEAKDSVKVDTPTETVNQKIDSEDKTEKVVVVNSKEEQKLLDDAKLDTYFDSPNGKMLKDIPAPSMDPKKGSGESIIIVNKKGQGSSAKNPSQKLSIEMTSLNQQTVNANRALKLGRFEAAKEMYDELYLLNPKDESVLSGRALVMQKMGQEDQAISAYEQLLKIYPDNIDAIINLSGLLRKQYPAVALNKLLDIHMDHPNNVFVIAQLGVTYADVGNYDDAIRYLSSAVAMDSKNAQHPFNLAVIQEKAGKPQDAIKNYEKALEIDSIFGEGKKTISREKIYDRLSQLRGN